jgi:hypothetical protein
MGSDYIFHSAAEGSSTTGIFLWIFSLALLYTAGQAVLDVLNGWAD